MGRLNPDIPEAREDAFRKVLRVGTGALNCRRTGAFHYKCCGTGWM